MSQIPQGVVDAIARKLADEGKLVEAGFAGLKLCFPGLSALELDRLRLAYMSGAQHLWGSFMGTVFDPGDEPTPDDMARMAMIEREMDDWAKILTARLLETKGTG